MAQATLERTVLAAGDGKTFPTQGQTLTMHYTGRLISNKKQFDSSVDRGTPFQFRIGIGQVIEGWDVGVAQMSLGEKAMLKIPSAMGYGARGAGNAIPPNADLGTIAHVCLCATCHTGSRDLQNACIDVLLA